MIFGGLHRREDNQRYARVATGGRPGRSPVHIALRFKHHTIEKRKAGPGDPVSMMSTNDILSECWGTYFCAPPDDGWDKPISELTP